MAGPLLIQRDDIDKPPMQAPREVPPWQGAHHSALDWRSRAVLCCAGIVAALLAYWLIGSDVRNWIRYGDGALLVWWVPRLLIGAAIAFLCRRLVLIDQPGGFKLFGWQVAQASGQEMLSRITDIQHGYATTQFRQVAAYTLTNPTKMLDAQVIDASPVDEGVKLTPDSDWLRWIDRAAHLLVAGKTDAGKTTFMSALQTECAHAGDQLLILDPHYQPGKWGGLPAVAGIPAILDMLPLLIEELDNRYKEFNAGKPTEAFDRLTVIIDEVPNIVDYCVELTPSGRPKIIDPRWPRFARKSASEARKVRMRYILGSQSTQVQDLLINKQMRENYTRIGIGNQARLLIGQEPILARRQQLYDLLRGQAYPAAMEYRNDFYLLDTSIVPALAERSVRSLARLWAIPEVNPTRSIAAPVSGLSVALRAHVKPGENGHVQTARQTDRRQTEWEHTKKVAVLRAMRQAGITRNAARDRLAGIGQGFDNDDWTEAGL